MLPVIGDMENKKTVLSEKNILPRPRGRQRTLRNSTEEGSEIVL